MDHYSEYSRELPQIQWYTPAAKVHISPQEIVYYTEELIEKAEQAFGKRIPRPEQHFDFVHHWSPAATSAKGLHWNLETSDLRSYRSYLIPHEVAHWITNQLFPAARNGHGEEWALVARTIGLTTQTAVPLPKISTPEDAVHQLTGPQEQFMREFFNETTRITEDDVVLSITKVSEVLGISRRNAVMIANELQRRDHVSYLSHDEVALTLFGWHVLGIIDQVGGTQ